MRWRHIIRYFPTEVGTHCDTPLADKAQVALKTFIDDVGMYAVEGALLGNLPTIFNPEVVADLDEEMITKVASESPETIIEREDLEKQLSTLEKSLKALQQIKIRQIPGMLVWWS
jgi:hypothetical protein